MHLLDMANSLAAFSVISEQVELEEITACTVIRLLPWLRINLIIGIFFTPPRLMLFADFFVGLGLGLGATTKLHGKGAFSTSLLQFICPVNLRKNVLMCSNKCSERYFFWFAFAIKRESFSCHCLQCLIVFRPVIF